MPFVEVKREKSFLSNEISVLGQGRITIAIDLLKHFPTKTVSIFVDVENKKIGFKDVGKTNLRTEKDISPMLTNAGLREYNLKRGRYPAKWSKKHQMLIAEIEFDD